MAAAALSNYLLMFFLFVALFITEAEMLSEKGDADQNVAWKKLPTNLISKQIIVSNRPGYGNYTTIQAAIDQGVPENNSQWIHIFVTAGFYGEQVVVPENKPYIFLEGDKRGSLVFYNSSEDIFNATFIVKANNFLARKMIFKNQMNIVRRVDDANKERQKAVAAHVGGDKIAFVHCSFLGVQDTLFDDCGRHYFYKCFIEGYVDFIFGSGQSVYQDCHIYVSVGDSNYSGPGFITAQKRNSWNEPSGFVLKHCTVDGKAQAYLGRAWGPYSRVFLFRSVLSNIINPAGWVAWTFVGQEDKLEYAEMNCTGPGANPLHRVKWEKQLTLKQANELVGNGFINSDGWLQRLPIKVSQTLYV